LDEHAKFDRKGEFRYYILDCSIKMAQRAVTLNNREKLLKEAITYYMETKEQFEDKEGAAAKLLNQCKIEQDELSLERLKVAYDKIDLRNYKYLNANCQNALNVYAALSKTGFNDDKASIFVSGLVQPSSSIPCIETISSLNLPSSFALAALV